MDGAASVRREYEQQQRDNILDLEKRKRAETSNVVVKAKEQEGQLEVSMGAQIENIKSQVFKIDGQIGQYESALNNPGVPEREKRKIREALNNLRNHKAYLLAQLSKARTRLRSSKNMIWFHVRTRKEMIESAMGEQRSLVLRKYAEIFSRLATSEAVAKAQQQAQARGGFGGRGGAKKPKIGGEGAAEGGKQAG